MSPLKFDSSGSATIRFFGHPAVVRIHWVAAILGQPKMVCPESIGAYKEPTPCRLCKASRETAVSYHELIIPGCPAKSTDRLCTCVWDVKEEIFRGWMIHPAIISNVFPQMKALGVTPADMSDGKGADVLVQKVGNRFETVVMPETLGQERGKEDWGKGPADFNKYMRNLEKNSIWKLYDDPMEVMRAYTKDKFDQTLNMSYGALEPMPMPTPVFVPPVPQATLPPKFYKDKHGNAYTKPTNDPIKPTKPPPKLRISNDPWDHL